MMSANFTGSSLFWRSSRASSIFNGVFNSTSWLVIALLLSLPLRAEEGFVPIFNGKDLSGWQSNRDEKKAGDGLFSVDPVAEVIHVYAKAKDGTPQPVDCLYTTTDFSHYILKLEYKWLDRRFPPRAEHDRDAGLLFHIHGDLGKIWPDCAEMQIGESDPERTTTDRYVTGDLWVLGRGVQVMNRRVGGFFYDPEAKLVLLGGEMASDRSYVRTNFERPHGEWNEMTLTVRGDELAIFELNGEVVNMIESMSFLDDGVRVPLEKGRIGLQAEYAELLYRNIRIKELKETEEAQETKE
jgi:hypothetical protein